MTDTKIIFSIDWGSKYIGLAYGKSDRQVPMPIDRLDNTGSVMFELANYIQKYGTDKIVVWFPSQNEMIQGKIDEFIKELSMVVPEKDIVKIDEDYSSIEAKADLGTYEKNYETDIVAAMKILKRYFEGE